MRPGPFADWDSRVEDDSEHWLSEGLKIGFHGALSGISFGLYEGGGKYRDDPAFEFSYKAGVVAGLAVTAIDITKGVTGAGRALKASWQWASQGRLGTRLGATLNDGTILINRALRSPEMLQELRHTVRHEMVHRLLTPKWGLLLEERQALNWRHYKLSPIRRYLEEALAEGIGTGDVIRGIAFPIEYGYVTPIGIAAEAAFWGALWGGATSLRRAFGR